MTGNEAATQIAAGYATDGAALELGAVVIDGATDPAARVRIPFATLNRHGLVAGATGTGKTKTLQNLAEQCSAAGVPVMLADVKGDLSGLARAGEPSDRTTKRAQETGDDWAPTAYPVRFLSLGASGVGVPVRATITAFGPILLSKVLGLNATQESTLGLIFHWADQKGLALLDTKDLRAVVQHLLSDEGKAELKGIGGVSTATAGVILRALVNLEARGGDEFFGEPEFDPADLLAVEDGRGVVTLLELADQQADPTLFSTFLMWLLAELFEDLPEAGDLDKPKLVFFFDEAHLLFADASKAFLDRIEQTVKLIRSKGVGVFFCTQLPTDIPNDVLSQLGARVQHALRAFTPDDQKALTRTARTYPKSSVYDIETSLTSLGIGEAIVTVLSERGAPTPVAWTRLRAPRSLMAAIGEPAVTEAAKASPLWARYGATIDRESAYERLSARTGATQAPQGQAEPVPADQPPQPAPPQAPPPAEDEGPGFFEKAMKSSIFKQIVRTVAREATQEITRGCSARRGDGAEVAHVTPRPGRCRWAGVHWPHQGFPGMRDGSSQPGEGRGRTGRHRMDRKRLLRNPLIWIVVLFVVYLVVSSFFSDTRGYTQASTSLALQQIDQRNVAEVTLEDKEQRLRMTLVNPVDVPPADGTSGAPTRTTQIYAQYPAAAGNQVFTELRENPARNGFDTQVTQESLLGQMLIYLIPLGLVLVLLFWMMNAQGGGNRVLSFGKSKAKQLNKDMPKTTFADVAGANEAVEELYEIKDFLQNPTRYQALGAKIPKGVLLYGPPGTGKTLLARAVAGEAGVPFYTISGSDFVEMFVGVGASRVRDLFEQAKQNSPCIVFVDEIDAVGRHRGAGMGGGHDEREQTLNQLLVEMDGFDARGGIILIAATNRPDILDPALLRPGRFDRQIPVAAPDLAGRRQILAVHSKGKPLAPDADLDGLAKRTVGFSGADLANVINEAALLTARLNQTQITGASLEESVDRVIGGPARKSRIISEQEKKVAAYHEAGHALAAWAMPDIEPVYKVTILPRGRTGGHALVVPEDDKELMTRSEMIARLVFAMGGRSAEELVFHEPTTGASSDIEQATKIARAMVTEYGMSAKLGAVKYGQEQGEPFLGRTAGKQSDYSLEVAHEIDEEVRKLIEAAHTEAWEILNTHRDALDALTGELIEHETLQRKDLERVFASVTKRPRITMFNDFGERTPSDRPPIKTRREIATERGEPWPPEDERREPARVGAGTNGHGPNGQGVHGQNGQNGAGQNGAGQPAPGQNGHGGWGAPNTPPVGSPAVGPGGERQTGPGTSGWGIPDVYRTGGSSQQQQPPSAVPPNYGAPPGWTPGTTPRGTSWDPNTRPYGQHGSGSSPSGWQSTGGQHAAPEDGGRRSAPDHDQPTGTSFTSPGEGGPNPYGDPDGRRPDGRTES